MLLGTFLQQQLLRSNTFPKDGGYGAEQEDCAAINLGQ